MLAHCILAGAFGVVDRGQVACARGQRDTDGQGSSLKGTCIQMGDLLHGFGSYALSCSSCIMDMLLHVGIHAIVMRLALMRQCCGGGT